MTYAQLQTDILDTLNRRDLAGAQVQRFIRLCESALDSELMGVKRQKRVTMFTGGGYVVLPADFRSIEHVEIEGRGELTPVNRNKADGERSDFGPDEIGFTPLASGGMVTSNSNGPTSDPCEYYISGEQLWFRPQPKNQTKVLLTYEGGIDRLSADVGTNWILERYEDLYLYGALVHTAPFLRNDDRLSTWASFYRAALDRANEDYKQSQNPHTFQREPSTGVV